ncbi:MAG: hypothetical protein LQ337_003375 [Flavoplaca oasis]|nr:MAG: hypothetical protein LQ337_003375 [Flavoplaca oasis]
MPFPILNLPLECRNMIYRDVMLSQEDENEMKTGFRWYELAYAPDVLEAKKARRKDAANFLLTCRQVRFEASYILSEERYYRVDNEYTWLHAGEMKVPDDEMPLYDAGQTKPPGHEIRESHTPPLDLLPLIRNLDISVAEPYSRRPNGILHLETALRFDDISDKNLGVLCSDLVSHAHRLKNLVIYIPCECSREPAYWIRRVRADGDWQRCFSVERLARQLAPLRRLRVRRIRFVQKCHSPYIAEIQPLLQDIAATVRSSRPVEPLSRDWNDWWDLRCEAHKKGMPGYSSFLVTAALHSMSSWFTDSHPLDSLGKSYQDQYRDHLQALREGLDHHTWDEDLMLTVIGSPCTDLI